MPGAATGGRPHRRRGDWSCSGPHQLAQPREAAAGALTGAIVQENQAARYGPPPPGGFPYARWAGAPGFYYSPYTGRVIFEEFHPAG